MNQFLDQDEKEEKTKPRLAELFAFMGVIVSIIIAGTTLLNYVGNVPLWWFHFSFIVLIALAFSTPLVVFAQPISERVKKWKVKRKQNSVAHRHFAEFKDIVDSFGTPSYSLSNVLEGMRNALQNEIKQKMGLLPILLLQVHNRNDLQNPVIALQNRLKMSEVTFTEFTFLIDQLNIILDISEKTLKVISEFRKGIESDAKASIEFNIPKRIETSYEEARETYNDFIKSYKKYCRKLNRELEERFFPEHFSLAKKW